MNKIFGKIIAIILMSSGVINCSNLALAVGDGVVKKKKLTSTSAKTAASTSVKKSLPIPKKTIKGVQGAPILPMNDRNAPISFDSKVSKASQNLPISGENTGAVEVLGQVRNLNMMLVLKNKGSGTPGFELRKDYKKEISITAY